MSLRGGLNWVDAQGQRVLHVINFTGSGFGSIIAALENHSSAVVNENWGGAVGCNPNLPTTTDYTTVRITAVLIFADATGSTAKLYVPAPNTSIFLADGDTVDPTAIPDIISAAIGTLLSGAGNPVTTFVGGIIQRTRFSGIVTQS